MRKKPACVWTADPWDRALALGYCPHFSSHLLCIIATPPNTRCFWWVGLRNSEKDLYYKVCLLPKAHATLLWGKVQSSSVEIGNKNDRKHAFSLKNLQQTSFPENMNLLSLTLKSAHRKFFNQAAFIARLCKRRLCLWLSPFLMASQCWHARYLRGGCASVFTKHVGRQRNETGVCSQAQCRGLWRKRDTMEIWPSHISISL